MSNSDPLPTLGYHRIEPNAGPRRPGWIGRLGITSTVFALFGIAAGLVRTRQAWEYTLDPTTHLYHPPPRWILRVHSFSVIAELGVDHEGFPRLPLSAQLEQ